MWLALLSLVVSQSVVDSSKLQLALSLGGGEGAAAETKLRADLRSAVPALSAVVRAQGPSALSLVMRGPFKCPGPMTGAALQMDRTPANDAAALLYALATESEEVRTQLAQSGNTLDLLVAVMGAWNDEKALEALLPKMEVAAINEPERRHLGLMQVCSAIRGNKPGSQRSLVLARLEQSSSAKVVKCDDAKSAAQVIGKGPIVSKGWSSGGDEKSTTAMFDVGGYSVTAKLPCVLALYDSAPAPRLLDVILLPEYPTSFEKPALDRLERDLSKFEPSTQKDVVRTLIGHGRQLTRLGEFSREEKLNSDDLLRGALLANDPDAMKLLSSRLACPAVGSRRVDFLLLVKDKRVAKQEALRIVEFCPRSGGVASVVLAKLGDITWLKHIPFVWEDSFARHDLAEALELVWSAPVEEQLKALSGSEEFIKWREEQLRKRTPMKK